MLRIPLHAEGGIRGLRRRNADFNTGSWAGEGSGARCAAGDRYAASATSPEARKLPWSWGCGGKQMVFMFALTWRERLKGGKIVLAKEFGNLHLNKYY